MKESGSGRGNAAEKPYNAIQTYDRVAHEFFGMGAVVDEAKAAQQMAADRLKKGFEREVTATR